MGEIPNRPRRIAEDERKARFLVSHLVLTNPFVGMAILVIFVLAGKVFRDNWKAKGENWKRNCWLAGLVALACFIILGFVPFVPR